jgi:hypothetical protein
MHTLRLLLLLLLLLFVQAGAAAVALEEQQLRTRRHESTGTITVAWGESTVHAHVSASPRDVVPVPERRAEWHRVHVG